MPHPEVGEFFLSPRPHLASIFITGLNLARDHHAQWDFSSGSDIKSWDVFYSHRVPEFSGVSGLMTPSSQGTPGRDSVRVLWSDLLCEITTILLPPTFPQIKN